MSNQNPSAQAMRAAEIANDYNNHLQSLGLDEYGAQCYVAGANEAAYRVKTRLDAEFPPADVMELARKAALEIWPNGATNTSYCWSDPAKNEAAKQEYRDYQAAIIAKHFSAYRDAEEKRRLVDYLKSGASAGADNMEGEDAQGFKYWEGHMIFCLDALKLLGISFDPITGKTKSTD